MPDKNDKHAERDRQSRATVPPPIPREDDPPLARSRHRDERPIAEPIARVALRAPPLLPPPSEHEEVMRALASISRERVALGEEREAFEQRMQESLRQIVIEEIPRHQTAAPPHADKERVSGSWFAHIPATLMGLAALIGVIAQSCQKKAEVSADVLAKIEAVDSHLSAHVAVSDQNKLDAKSKELLLHSYLIGMHNWQSDVFERLSVKVDDPPGAPSHQKLEFYAVPARGSKAPLIQPNATFPYPP